MTTKVSRKASIISFWSRYDIGFLFQVWFSESTQSPSLKINLVMPVCYILALQYFPFRFPVEIEHEVMFLTAFVAVYRSNISAKLCMWTGLINRPTDRQWLHKTLKMKKWFIGPKRDYPSFMVSCPYLPIKSNAGRITEEHSSDSPPITTLITIIYVSRWLWALMVFKTKPRNSGLSRLKLK